MVEIKTNQSIGFSVEEDRAVANVISLTPGKEISIEDEPCGNSRKTFDKWKTILVMFWVQSAPGHLKVNIRIWASALRSMPPASCFSVHYRSISVPDWVPLFRYQIGSGIGIFVHSSTGLAGSCQTVRHSGISKRCMPCNVNKR
jgi:hypothetical protein